MGREKKGRGGGGKVARGGHKQTNRKTKNPAPPDPLAFAPFFPRCECPGRDNARHGGASGASFPGRTRVPFSRGLSRARSHGLACPGRQVGEGEREGTGAGRDGLTWTRSALWLALQGPRRPLAGLPVAGSASPGRAGPKGGRAAVEAGARPVRLFRIPRPRRRRRLLGGPPLARSLARSGCCAAKATRDSDAGHVGMPRGSPAGGQRREGGRGPSSRHGWARGWGSGPALERARPGGAVRTCRSSLGSGERGTLPPFARVARSHELRIRVLT